VLSFFKGLCCFICLYSLSTFATHQRAAEITYKHISGYTYEFTLVTYTFTPSLADRPQLDLNWGDGSTGTISRFEKTEVPNVLNITKNVYIGTHTYAAPSTYVVSMEDPNRNYGVLNIPYSVNVPMYVSTTIVVNPFLHPNSSPILTFPPIDIGCVGVPFYHNPGAYDPDGDSLSFKLAPCKGESGLNIIGYSYPQTSNIFSIDPITGTLTWNSPIIQGEYNVAIVIEEYRNGILLSAITRDMQINIISCNNQPPIISTISDTCITAGETLLFDVFGNDPNDLNITLSATGGPFEVPSSPATFPTVSGYPVITGTFTWNTECSHVQKHPYYTYFRLQDNNATVNLIDIKVTRITVVAPAPENLVAEPLGTSIRLQWDASICQNAKGYKIYRRVGFYGFVPDICETGVPAYTGYQYIGKTDNWSETIFIDDNNGAGLTHGLQYCYMVIAYFTDGAESYASNEACTSLNKDIPVITNVSIRETDITNGSVFVAWSKPTDIDTILYPGPYEYKIKRGQGFQPVSFEYIHTYTELNDTTFIDTLLNTEVFPYSYIIEFYDNSQTEPVFIGKTIAASSVFLTIEPYDQTLFLNWSENVPWTNYLYSIYRLNSASQEYEFIGTSTTQKYTDTGLDNQTEYCYKVVSEGSYFTDGIIHPIINHSQTDCETPYDMVAPCTPTLIVSPDCELPGNILTWNNPILTCEYSGDTDHYNIYFSSTPQGTLQLIHTETNPYTTTFIHQLGNTIAGCYAINAVDSIGNTSPLSSVICIDIDSCSLYLLPNVFTPNNDGFNDYWRPFPYDFVKSIDLTVFNRWGKIVFETNDPEVMWNGKHFQSNQDVSDGVYFYVCDVYELRLSGEQKRTLTGSVTIIRNPQYKIN